MSVPHPSVVDLYRASFSDELYEDRNAEKEASYAFLDRLEKEGRPQISATPQMRALHAILNPQTLGQR